MARIVIIGGHGKVALLLARILAHRGDQVSSVFRNPDHAEEVAVTGALPVVADIEQLDTDGLARLVAGHDAVVFSAGAHLRATGLDWTVLGPSRLTLEPATDQIAVGPDTGKGQVSRGNVARVIAACLSDDSTIGRTIAFNDGQTPIPEALRGD